MKLTFLGTAAGKPSKDRNVTSIAIELEDNEYILIDCGESTQHQILKSKLKFNKLNSIFITHLHGDHVFGLPGLLSTINEYRVNDLIIHGPVGIGKFVNHFLNGPYSNIGNYKIIIKEYDKKYNNLCEIVCRRNVYKIESCFVKHREFCYAYKITQTEIFSKIDIKKIDPILKENKEEILKLGFNPIYKIIDKLKRDKEVKLENVHLKLDDFDFPKNKLSLLICLDNCDITDVLAFFKKCDILVHECTYIIEENFEKEIYEKAILYGHSTNRMAAQNAVKLNAQNLILTHFSNKYEIDKGKMIIESHLLNDTTKYFFDKIFCAYDFSEFNLC